MTTTTSDVSSGIELSQARSTEVQRNAGLDALRASTTLLVVFHHCAITYGAIGGWYYQEVPPAMNFASVCLVLFCSVNQAFFMGLFFLLAGYYTRPSLARKGPRRFLIDRLLRLGVPLLFYGFLIGPATIALAQTHRSIAFEATFRSLFANGTFDCGPMWFAQALLLFTALLIVAVAASKHFGLRRSECPASFPSNRALAIAALLTGATALALRTQWPVGVNVWGLQLGYFASYVVLFVAGFAAANGKRLESLPAPQVRLWRRIALVTLPTLPLAYFLSKALPQFQGVVRVLYAFWEPFVAWGTIMSLIGLFERHFTTLHGVIRQLSRRAYTIYIVHPPVLVAAALIWKDVHANALFKFAVTGSLSCAACYLIAGVVLSAPVIKRIL